MEREGKIERFFARVTPLFKYLMYLLLDYWYAQDKGQVYMASVVGP